MTFHTGARGAEAAAQQDYLERLATTLARRWLFISVSTIAMTAALAAGIECLPKTYQGVASVEVLSKTPTVASPDIVTGDSVFTDETAGTELGIFNSQELQTAVIKQLNLLQYPEWNPNLRRPLMQRITEFLAQSPFGRFVPTDWLPRDEPASDGKTLYDTRQVFMQHVTVEPVSHSKIIQVTVSSRNPEMAAAVANAITEEYIATHQRQKENAYEEAYTFTNHRLPALRADMIAKAQLVNTFRQQHHMVSGQYAAIRREKLTEASRQLVDAQNRLEQLKAEVAQSRHTDMMHNPAVLASATIARLREQEASLASEGAGHPTQGPTYQLRLQAVENNIRAEAARIVASLPDQVAAQEATVASQRAEVLAIQSEVSDMDTLQSLLDPLENDARISTKQYTDFLSSDTVSRPDVAFTAVNVRVLSAAAVPYRAHFPNPTIMFPGAFVLSFLTMSGVALYRGRRRGFVTTSQFQNVFNIEPIGKIPFRIPRLEQVYWEAIMFLSMRLLSPYEKSKQTILVTSARPDEGKTTIATGLAQMFARRNISVALVDADLRLARAESSGRDPVIGLREVLCGEASLERALTVEQGITVINAGSSRVAHPTSPIASDKMPKLLDQLQSSHDIVIIDGPPAPIGGDSWALSKLVDRVLFVVKQSGSDEIEVQEAFAALDRAPSDIDVVLNMIRMADDPAFANHMLHYYGTSKGRYVSKRA